MAQGQNTRNATVAAIALIPTFVKLMESIFGHGNGADKKAAVQGLVGSVIALGGTVAATANPAYSPLIGNVIDAVAGALFPKGTTNPDAAVGGAGVPPPLPPASASPVSTFPIGVPTPMPPSVAPSVAPFPGGTPFIPSSQVVISPQPSDVPMYDTWFPGDIPNSDSLKQAGYQVGDGRWSRTNPGNGIQEWSVWHAGVNVPGADGPLPIS